jgi:type II secretory pathway pseudopilin PulG
MRAMTTLPGRRGALGYVLNEMLLAVAVFAVLSGIAGVSYQSLKRSAQADDQAQKFASLANDIRKSYRPLGSFTTLTGTGVSKLGLVQKPMYTDGTNVFDAWANQLGFVGSDTAFAVVLGGNGIITPQECTAFASAVQDGAYEVRIGAAVALGAGATLGRTTGGYGYKTAGGTFDGSALQSGCSEASTKIGVSFDG